MTTTHTRTDTCSVALARTAGGRVRVTARRRALPRDDHRAGRAQGAGGPGAHPGPAAGGRRRRGAVPRGGRAHPPPAGDERHRGLRHAGRLGIVVVRRAGRRRSAAGARLAALGLGGRIEGDALDVGQSRPGRHAARAGDPRAGPVRGEPRATWCPARRSPARDDRSSSRSCDRSTSPRTGSSTASWLSGTTASCPRAVRRRSASRPVTACGGGWDGRRTRPRPCSTRCGRLWQVRRG